MRIRNFEPGIGDARPTSAGTGEETRPSRMSFDALFLLAALVLYALVMPWVGFAASTLVFTFAVMWRLGTHWLLAVAGSVVLVITIHLLFVILFKVQLP